MLIEYPQLDYVHEDERGVLKQLVHTGFKQVNYVFSCKGSSRGGHYHIKNDELFFIISGKFNLRLEKGEIKEEYELGEGSFFLIPRGVTHSFDYTEDTMLISMYSNGVEMDDGMDIHQ